MQLRHILYSSFRVKGMDCYKDMWLSLLYISYFLTILFIINISNILKKKFKYHNETLHPTSTVINS